jgi:hypothetical protein
MSVLVCPGGLLGISAIEGLNRPSHGASGLRKEHSARCFPLKVRPLNSEWAPSEFVHHARLPKKPLPNEPNCGCWASRMGGEP